MNVVPALDSGETTVRGSIAGPYVRTLLLFQAGLSPLDVAGLYAALRGLVFLPFMIALILSMALVMAGLAWLAVASTVVSVTVGPEQVVVVQRGLGRAGRSGVAIPWAGFGPRVVFGSFIGRVGIHISRPSGVLVFTLDEAKAILRHPKCPPCDCPPELARRFDRV